MGDPKLFEGQSQKSIEEAIQNAIANDPRGDAGTDLFHYKVADLNVDWGGIVQTTTYKVKLERIKQ